MGAEGDAEGHGCRWVVLMCVEEGRVCEEVALRWRGQEEVCEC